MNTDIPTPLTAAELDEIEEQSYQGIWLSPRRSRRLVALARRGMLASGR